MRQFDNVSVERKANLYFDGNVSSRTLTFANGEVKTLGIMMPGEYTFGTSQKELMEISAGKLDVRLAGSDTWTSYQAGSRFNVEANSSFDVVVKEITDYCCSYS